MYVRIERNFWVNISYKNKYIFSKKSVDKEKQL